MDFPVAEWTARNNRTVIAHKKGKPPEWPEASQEACSALQDVSGDPLLGLKRHIYERLKLIQTE